MRHLDRASALARAIPRMFHLWFRDWGGPLVKRTAERSLSVASADASHPASESTSQVARLLSVTPDRGLPEAEAPPQVHHPLNCDTTSAHEGHTRQLYKPTGPLPRHRAGNYPLVGRRGDRPGETTPHLSTSPKAIFHTLEGQRIGIIPRRRRRHASPQLCGFYLIASHRHGEPGNDKDGFPLPSAQLRTKKMARHLRGPAPASSATLARQQGENHWPQWARKCCYCR